MVVFDCLLKVFILIEGSWLMVHAGKFLKGRHSIIFSKFVCAPELFI